MARDLEKLLSNLGYGSRTQVARLLRDGAVTDAEGRPLGPKDSDPGGVLLVDGEPLDPRAPVTLVLHKPVGVVCSTSDPGATVYSLLPPRFAARKPVIAPIGRLDKESSGLLLLTDDGALNHRLTSPKHHVEKRYEVILDRPLRGDEAALFAAGGMLLDNDDRPLLPARLLARPGAASPADGAGDTVCTVVLTEGRYHQVRRMFAALGNHVLQLHRSVIGGLALPDDLPAGAWRPIRPEEAARVPLA